jgi:4-diphosphocytidyl-2-C-methyl-D-erythritol kinase
MSVHRALAPAKVNLGLFLGPRRESDGRHELVSVMQSISLADELTLEPGAENAAQDELICPGVSGGAAENLAGRALSAFRASTGWPAPPLRLRIVKRIPVAAGLAGGSADAAAALRLAMHASGLGEEELLLELAGELGADVPAQVSPGRWLASGAGERLQPDAQLSTAAVYAEADRLGLAREPGELRERMLALLGAMSSGEPLPADGELLTNDLQSAAISLCPQIASTVDQALQAGATHAFVSGSGPTVVGLFQGDGRSADGGLALAQRAAARLWGRSPSPIAARVVDAAFARAVSAEEA